MRMLVAVASDHFRAKLVEMLGRAGHDVLTASTGDAAWEQLRKDPVRLVLADLGLSGLDGVALARRIRSSEFPHYIYIALIAPRDAAQPITQSLKAGADDFITLPFTRSLLLARLLAAERILQLHDKLESQNQRLSEAYRRIEDDLATAQEMQRKLLPPSGLVLKNVEFSWMYQPSMFVGGDSLNYFDLDAWHVGFYQVDVAGHGIPSAFLSVMLSKVLTPDAEKGGLLKPTARETLLGEFVRSPHDVVADLNRMLVQEDDAMQYFTMIYGVINCHERVMNLCQAGHPCPAYLPVQGKARLLGDGGFPVAMFEDATYEMIELDVAPGDRIVLYSDGVTECLSNRGERFGDRRLLDLLEGTRSSPLEEVMGEIAAALDTWCNSEKPDDDLSVLAMEITPNYVPRWEGMKS